MTLFFETSLCKSLKSTKSFIFFNYKGDNYSNVFFLKSLKSFFVNFGICENVENNKDDIISFNFTSTLLKDFFILCCIHKYISRKSSVPYNLETKVLGEASHSAGAEAFDCKRHSCWLNSHSRK